MIDSGCEACFESEDQWLAHLKEYKPEKFDHYQQQFNRACANGFLKVASQLLEMGDRTSKLIDIHYDKEFPFRIACKNNKKEMAEWLIELGDLMNQPINIHAEKEWAFCCLLYYGHFEMAKWLWDTAIKRDSRININIDDDLPFSSACYFGDITMMEWILQTAQEIEKPVNLFVGKYYHIYQCCINGKLAATLWLYQHILDSGKNIDIDITVSDIFEEACKEGHSDIVEWLLGIGKQDNCEKLQDKIRKGFDLALQNGHIEVLKRLEESNLLDENSLKKFKESELYQKLFEKKEDEKEASPLSFSDDEYDFIVSCLNDDTKVDAVPEGVVEEVEEVEKVVEVVEEIEEIEEIEDHENLQRSEELESNSFDVSNDFVEDEEAEEVENKEHEEFESDYDDESLESSGEFKSDSFNASDDLAEDEEDYEVEMEKPNEQEFDFDDIDSEGEEDQNQEQEWTDNLTEPELDEKILWEVTHEDNNQENVNSDPKVRQIFASVFEQIKKINKYDKENIPEQEITNLSEQLEIEKSGQFVIADDKIIPVDKALKKLELVDDFF